MSPPVNMPKDLNGNPAHDPSAPRWLRWFIYSAERFGVATVVLLAASYWFAVKVGEPLVQSHVEFLRMQEKTTMELVENNKRITVNTDQALKNHGLILETEKQVASNQAAALDNDRAIAATQNKLVDQALRQIECLDRLSVFCGKVEQTHDQQNKKLDSIDAKLPAKVQ